MSKKFQYWLIAVVLLVIIVTRGVMFAIQHTEKLDAKAMLIRPMAVEIVKNPHVVSQQFAHKVAMIGKFKHFDKITSFRQFDHKGKKHISAVIKLKYAHGVAYLDMDFKKRGNTWYVNHVKQYFPK